MSLPFGLGESTYAGTQLANANESDQFGIPLVCRNPITLDEDGYYNAPIFTKPCVAKIVYVKNKPIDNKHKLTKDDITTLARWWNTHLPSGDVSDEGGTKNNRGFQQSLYWENYTRDNILIGLTLDDLDDLNIRNTDPIRDIQEGAESVQRSMQDVQKILQWTSDSYNWTRLAAIFFGLVLILVGSRRLISSDTAYESE